MIVITVQIDLRTDNEQPDRRALSIAHRAPRGCKIMALVGERTFCSPYLLDNLSKFATSNVLEFVGTPEAVEAFSTAVYDQISRGTGYGPAVA